MDPHFFNEIRELAYLAESPEWLNLPDERQPSTLAQLSVNELDLLYVTGVGPFAEEEAQDGVDTPAS